jgi:hypothetical protein
MRAARSRPIACRRPSISTVTGPSNGPRSKTRTFPGGNQPEISQVAEKRGIIIGDAHDRGPPSLLDFSERSRLCSVERELARRNRITVRVVTRIPEKLVDLRLDPVGEMVLEEFGFGVHLVPAEPERLGQVELEEAMVTDDLECDTLAGRRERGAAVGLVLDEIEAEELLEHARHRPGRYS